MDSLQNGYQKSTIQYAIVYTILPSLPSFSASGYVLVFLSLPSSCSFRYSLQEFLHLQEDIKHVCRAQVTWTCKRFKTLDTHKLYVLRVKVEGQEEQQ